MKNNSIISQNILQKNAQKPNPSPKWLSRWIVLGLLFLSLQACAQTGGASEVSILHPPTKAPTPTLLPPKEIDLTGQLDAQGKALSALVLDAPDGCLHLEIDAGTSILNPAGNPAEKLVIQQDFPGKPPMEAYSVPISYAYRFGPQELRFSAPVRLVFTCLKSYKKSSLHEISVGMKNDSGGWDQWSVQGDDISIWTRVDQLLLDWKYFLLGPAPMGS